MSPLFQATAALSSQDPPSQHLSSHGEQGDASARTEQGAPVAHPPFQELVSEYSGFVWRSLRFHGVSDADLPDQSQEVFLVVHRRAEAFTGSGTIRAWIYGICRRVAIAHRRKAYMQREILQQDGATDGAGQPAGADASFSGAPQVSTADQMEQAQNKQTLTRLLDVLMELPMEARETFVLFEIEELAMKDVAETLGCPLQTAYSRLQAARVHVRKRFKEPDVSDTVGTAEGQA